MKHLKVLLLLLLLFGSFVFMVILPSLRAAGTTSIIISPSYAVEGSTVDITLSLTSYSPSQKFNFTLQVTDPASHNSTGWRIATVGSGGTASLSFSYPSTSYFNPSPTTDLNGTYAVQIIFSNATMGTYPTTPVHFSVGPADRTVYQLTQTVSILARGYTPTLFTHVNISHGGFPVGSFPHTLRIGSNGVVTDSWKIPLNAALGSYLVQVLGNSTKSLPDNETITIVPAVLTLKGLGAATASGVVKSNLVRGDAVFAIFNATYPDGNPVTAASAASVKILNSSNALVDSLPASYNSTQKQFLTSSSHLFNISAPLGTWTLKITANSINDGSGNLGPVSDLTATFTLSPLTLQTSITSLKNTYNRTATFSVNATVGYPTSDTFDGSSGAVSANLTSGTRMIPVSLVYNSITHKWTGSITIPPDYPLGSATLQVSAHDNYRNTGSDTSLHLTITPTIIIVQQVPFNINGTGSFQPFQTFAIQINATYINNQTLLQGPGGIGRVTFSLPGGGSISVALTLQTNHTLTGQYTIRDNDPLGTWNLTLVAGELNDGYGNTNTKNILGPVIKVLPLLLTFDSSLVPSSIVTGDKATMGVAFRYPNGNLAQNLYVNGTVLVNGKNMTFTFAFDTGTQKYLARIDTTGWAPGQYQLNIYASLADYRGYHALGFNLQATPYPVGPIIGAVLILVALGLGFLEYTRRKVPSE